MTTWSKVLRRFITGNFLRESNEMTAIKGEEFVYVLRDFHLVLDKKNINVLHKTSN